MKRILRKHLPFILGALTSSLLTFPAWAASKKNASFIWDDLLLQLSENIATKVAVAIGIIAIVFAALSWAFGDSQSAGRRMGQAIIGLGIALGAIGLAGQIATIIGALI